MKARPLISFVILLISLISFLPDAGAQIRSRKQIIEDLTRRLDSLQNAYDSLAYEYNLLAVPVSGDVEEGIAAEVSLNRKLYT